MDTEFIVPPETASKAERYQSLHTQLIHLTENETDFIANCANIIAALHETMQFWWTGVYFVKGNELVLGPFQGPLACTRIAFGKGVCGTAWKEMKSQLVPDVNEFPGHIACSSVSKSEVVVPVFVDNKIVMVLDVDSQYLNNFNTEDVEALEKISVLFSELFKRGLDS